MKNKLLLFALLLSALCYGQYGTSTTQSGFSYNSTVTPIADGATYTGTGESTIWPDVMVSCTTDATGTLYFDFSTDNTNWSSFPVNGFDVADGIHEFHTAVKGMRWFRVRLIDDSDGDTQTYLRITTYYGEFRQGNLPINANIGSDADAIVVRSVNSELDLALGRFGGMESGTKFGRNSDVDVAAAEDIWHGGSDYTGQPVSFTPETIEVFSSSTSDDDGDTGARTIRIFGLKSSTSTEYESEDLTMNGTTAVTSVNTWWRINRAYVLTAGSTGNNVGNITIRPTTTTASVFAVMPATYNQTQIAAYTVPAGKTLLIKRIRVSITRANGSAGSANVTLRARETGGVYRSVRNFEIQTGAPTEFQAFAGDILPAGTDIKFRTDAVSDNNTIPEAALEYVLIDN